jgi:hypothetical protein
MGLLRRKSGNGIDDLRARKAALAATLTKVEADLSAAIDERRRTLCAGDDGQPLPAVTELMDRRDGLTDAIREIDGKIAAAEAEAAAERDRVTRQAEAELRSKQIESAREALAHFRAASGQLIEALAPLCPVNVEVAGAANNARNLPGFVAVGVESALAAARNYCAAVAAGAPIVGSPPAIVAASKPVAPPIERVRCMLYQNGKWREPDGSVKACARHGIADLPRDLAMRCIAAGLAVREDSDMYKRLRATDSEAGYGQAWGAPSPDYCLDLDNPDAPKPQAEQTAASAPEYVGTPRHGVATISAVGWR